ncbi:autotransporter outer membrane beta-barrel domain-containing protein [Methylobacterium sp. 1030]|uniref:autotransporter outer membrane beta-barrel domain-containing protein n=1 Tax=Methylobacterium sp. 1030 TaxID=3156404 RepID=UPI00339AC0A2
MIAGGLTGTTSDAADVSAALKHQIGPWLLAASANLGYSWADNKRLIDFGGATATARSKSGILSAGGRLRASYQILFGDWYLKPYADLDLLYSFSPAYSETGAPGFNLDMRPVAKTLVAFSPMMEIGGRIDLDVGRWVRTYGTLGLFATESAIPDRLGEVGWVSRSVSAAASRWPASIRARSGTTSFHMPARPGCRCGSEEICCQPHQGRPRVI